MGNSIVACKNATNLECQAFASSARSPLQVDTCQVPKKGQASDMLKELNSKYNFFSQLVNWLYLPDFVIRVLFKRVKIDSDCTFEQGGILWYDAEPSTEIMKANSGNVYVINNDFPICRFNKAEKCLYKCRFTTSSAPNDPNLFATRKRAGYAMENHR